MSLAYATIGTPVRISASGAVKKIPGACVGFIINSTSSGTLALFDGADGSGTAFLAITPAVNTFYPIAAAFTTGLYATIANSLDVTFFVA